MNCNPLPDQWSRRTLRDLATINYGRDASAILDADGSYPVYGTSGSERLGTAFLYEGDSIILGRKGTIDRVHFATGRFWTIDTAYFLSNFKNAVPKWLFYSLTSIDLRSLNEATGVPSLSRDLLYKIKVPTPTVAEQTKIAEILSTVDQAIKHTEALIAKQQRIKTGLMNDLLTHGIDDRGNLRSEQTHEFKDSPLGRIPQCWDVMRVDELLADVDPAMRSGPFGSALLKHELTSSGVPLLGIDNIFPEEFRPDYIRYVSAQKARQLHRYRVRPRDIMITIMGTVGRSCVVPDDVGEALSSKHVWTISLDAQKYSSILACYQINYSPWVLAHFARDEQGGVMASIKSDTLRSTRLPVPPREEQRLIESKLSALNSYISTLSKHLGKLRSLKTALMQDLLTDRRRVTALLIQPGVATA